MTRRKEPSTVTIIGAGAVGTAFAVALTQAGYRIIEIQSLHRRSARRIARTISSNESVASSARLVHSPDILLLAVPDQAIKSVVRAVADAIPNGLARTTVLHSSGALGSDILLPLSFHGASIGSLHPIQMFPKRLAPKELGRRMSGISFGFEGDARAQQVARKIVQLLNGRFIRVPKERKILYHLACVFASNYVVALLEAVKQSAKRVGGGFRLQDVEQLLLASISSTMTMGPKAALTGPIVRGSIEIVHAHVLELQRSSPELLSVYRALGMIATDLANRSNLLDVKSIRQLRRIFGNQAVERENIEPRRRDIRRKKTTKAH
jgi:predicted short-subunit dehydrogenase-like oxidoreductase (DUF2520 family)